MLLWEGMLVQGENMAVIIPTAWEWDSPDRSDSERLWDGGSIQWLLPPEGPTTLQTWFDLYKQAYLVRIANRSGALFAGPDTNYCRDCHNSPWVYLGAIPGNRPIGQDAYWRTTGNAGYLRLAPVVLTLTYDAAMQAIKTNPSRLGPGVIAVNYADVQDHGNYTLYLQVELVR